MKKILFFSFLLLSLSNLVYSQVNSNWKWSHPYPQGNTLRFVQIFSSTSWVGLGYAGTFIKTTNGGASWYVKTDVAGVSTTDQIYLYNGWFFDANTGLACGELGKIMRTTNGGINWDSTNTGVTVTIYGLHFINANTGFAGGATGTVLKTTNAGLNWSPLSTGITTTINNIYALDANYIYAPTTAGNLRITTDGGTSWSTQSTGASVTVYDVAFKDVNTGIVCGSSTALRMTTNGGANWTATNTGLPTSTFYNLSFFPNLSDDPRGVDTWYASGNSFYAFRSVNNGQTWDSVSLAGSQTYVSTYYDLDRNGNNMVTGGAFGLINSSTNAGANWVAHNTLPSSSAFNDLWVESMNGKIIAVGSVAPTPIMFTSNGGTTWSTSQGAAVNVALNGIKMIDANTGYVCGSTSKVFKTTNGGSSWDSVSFTGVSTTLYCPEFVNSNTGWVSGSSGRIFKTTNGGSNWELLTTGVTNALYRIDMFDANTGWVVGTTGTGRKTTDGGTTWNAMTLNTASSINWIQMLDANSGYVAGLSGTVRKTTNGGTTWDTVQTALTTSLYSASFVNMNNGFISGATGVTLRTTNGGNAWQILNTSAATMNAIYTKHPDSAWVCGSSGALLKFTQGLTGVPTWTNEVPVNYTLSQNYPNPFNPTTTIKFGLPKAGMVSLKIYDIVGREVNVIFNNMPLNAGTVTFDFDGTNFASGVYFYSLYVNDDRIDTKKMVLVK